jgi:DNA-binding transcriptional regulator YhcF (GntR family)
VILEVNADDPTPPYEQIRSQVVRLVMTGDLPVGVRLPSIRQLAGDLGLAPGTVARAYRELEAAGVVASRVGRGTTVSAVSLPETTEAQQHKLLAAAREYVAAGQRIGAGPEQMIAVLEAELADVS